MLLLVFDVDPLAAGGLKQRHAYDMITGQKWLMFAFFFFQTADFVGNS